ncbi:MAG: iron-containing alcohol dehydrogenase [Bacilli bacterium]|nr:iron-containing alcohol dehydrogenase [Bacilli bacterium]
MVNRVVLNETSYFGRGSRSKLGEELKERGLNKVLLVTDFRLMDNNVTKMVIDVLESMGITYFVYLHVKPNPTVKNVQDGLMLAQISNVDAIVAVGGGSVIDTAKAISIIMTNPEHSSVTSLAGVVNTKNKGLPLFALPTTAGTAAEVTINYVITDEVNTKKMVCVDVHDIPVCSIIDPDLMQSMPQRLAATTGMDALTHAMEGYITKAGWLIPDMFHINAMALIYKNLEAASNEKDDLAVEKMAYAQYIAGMGFSNVGLGICHSLAHSLGAFFETPHGLANAILLPHVMRFNGAVCPELFVNMGNAFGLDMEGLSDEEAVDTVVNAIQDLSIRLDIPQKLSELGIPESMLPQLAAQAINDICTGGNPREVTVEDMINIYKAAY